MPCFICSGFKLRTFTHLSHDCFLECVSLKKKEKNSFLKEMMESLPKCLLVHYALTVLLYEGKEGINQGFPNVGSLDLQIGM